MDTYTSGWDMQIWNSKQNKNLSIFLKTRHKCYFEEIVDYNPWDPEGRNMIFKLDTIWITNKKIQSSFLKPSLHNLLKMRAMHGSYLFNKA